MFARIATFFVFCFFTLCVSAIAIPRDNDGQCNTGSIQCCNSVQDADSTPVTILAGLLNIVLGPVTGQVGVHCSPISAVGLGGNSCTQQPVCCNGNNYNGIIVVGCTPININL